MSLKINNWRTIAKWVVWAVIAIVFLAFFIRVAVFENEYYSSKQGSERVAAETISAGDELEEEKPDENAVKEYTVAADRPRYLSIEKLNITNARVLAMGVNTSGELDTPRNIFDVGWYDGSGKPGQGGTMVIDGHNGGPHVHGVFKDLPNLAIGEIITIERGDGVKYNYRVVENEQISLDESNKYMATAMKSPENGKESVTLITCSGDWSDERKTYLSRQFVRAVLVE
jgi:LPXTG-site transpeptidase (sortase) family protein